MMSSMPWIKEMALMSAMTVWCAVGLALTATLAQFMCLFGVGTATIFVTATAFGLGFVGFGVMLGALIEEEYHADRGD